MVSVFKGLREDFTKDFAFEGRLEDQVRAGQEGKPSSAEKTECTKVWQQGKA